MSLSDELRRVYADTQPETENDREAYGRAMEVRELDWLSEAVSPGEAADALCVIGRYNGFDPTSVASELREFGIEQGNLVQVGREGSPVIYFLFEDRQGREAHPQQNDFIQQTGEVLMWLADDLPTVDELNVVEPGKIRAWWD